MNALQKMRKPQIILRLLAVFLIIGLLSGVVFPVRAATAPSIDSTTATVSPRLIVVSVKAGYNVTLLAQNMPANSAVTIRMSKFGSKATGGAIAGHAVTWANGTYQGTFTIPGSLRAQPKIAVRMEVTARPKVFAYTWFSNVIARPNPTIPPGTISAGNLTITNVEEDDRVSYKLTGAPYGATLAVWIDWKLPSGVMQGRQVDTLYVKTSGTITDSADIPLAARDRGALRLRLQSATYVAYRWFLNVDSGSGAGSGAPATYPNGLPFLRILNVVEDKSVTLKAFNLPIGEYTVRMDEEGTSGRKGIIIKTVRIKTDKPYTDTFTIPADLEGEAKIVVRFQNNDDSRYYTYTTFKNEDSE